MSATRLIAPKKQPITFGNSGSPIMKKIPQSATSFRALFQRGSAVISVTLVVLFTTTASLVALSYYSSTAASLDSLGEDQSASGLVLRTAMELAQARLSKEAKSADSDYSFRELCEGGGLTQALTSLRFNIGAGTAFYSAHPSLALYTSSTPAPGTRAEVCTFIASGLANGSVSQALGQINAQAQTQSTQGMHGVSQTFSFPAQISDAKSAILTHIAYRQDGTTPTLTITNKVWQTTVSGSNSEQYHNSAGVFTPVSNPGTFSMNGAFTKSRNWALTGAFLYADPRTTSAVTRVGSHTRNDEGGWDSGFQLHKAGFNSGWKCGMGSLSSNSDASNWSSASTSSLLTVSLASPTLTEGGVPTVVEIGQAPESNRERSVSLGLLTQVIGTSTVAKSSSPLSMMPVSQIWYGYNDSMPLTNGTSSTSTTLATNDAINASVLTGSRNTLRVTSFLPTHSLKPGDKVYIGTTPYTISTTVSNATPCGDSLPCTATGNYILSTNATAIAASSLKIEPRIWRIQLASTLSKPLLQGTVLALPATSPSYTTTVFQATTSGTSMTRVGTTNPSGANPYVGDAIFGPGVPPNTFITGRQGPNSYTVNKPLPTNTSAIRLVARAAVLDASNNGNIFRMSRPYNLTSNTTQFSSRQLCAGVCALLRMGAQVDTDYLYIKGAANHKLNYNLSCMANVDPAKIDPAATNVTTVQLYANSWQVLER